ncbi:MAG: protein arginine kinase [Clostridia bacterium]|nr:protein arginine kinase [Clostridia bacterium]
MAKWYSDTTNQSDIVLSTRIRLARNLKGIPFPPKMTAEDAKKVVSLVETALDEMNYTFIKYDMQNLSTIEKQRLVEEHYISPDFAATKLPSCVYISEDNNVSIMVNEEDHLRIQCIYGGFEDEKAYDLIGKIDSYLSEKLDYAVHEKYGHLTSCLTNVGTGMRISYMLHLPAIVAYKAADSIFSAIGKLGATVRGVYGEGTKSTGYVFQISNQITLGKDETEIKSSLNETVEGVITKERELRKEIYKQKGLVLEDKIMRSLGTLTSARIMQSSEMLSLLSDVRLGISLGIIDNTDVKTVNSLMVTASRAHLTDLQNPEPDFERDIKRAKFIRETLNK